MTDFSDIPLANPALFAVEGYRDLHGVLSDAYAQATSGKGEQRHGRGKPFAEQPIMSITEMLSLDGPTFQIIKKAQEAAAMARNGDHEAAIRELYGVINYAGACVLHCEKQIMRRGSE